MYELPDGYHDYLRDHKGRRHSTLLATGGLVDPWISSHVGDKPADKVLADDLEAVLGAMRAAG